VLERDEITFRSRLNEFLVEFVVESAELVARRIVDTYLAPNKTFLELREMVNSGTIDLLRDFSETCRTEFESLRTQF